MNLAKVCIILFVTLLTTVFMFWTSYLALHYGWGLEVVSWPMLIMAWCLSGLAAVLSAGLQLIKEAID